MPSRTAKLFFVFFLTSAWLIFGLQPVSARQDSLNLYLFYSKYCPHCEQEISFLSNLQKEIPQITIHAFEIAENKTNNQLLQKVGQKLNVDISGVPMLFIGAKPFIGFFSDETTGTVIKSTVLKFLASGCEDPLASLVANLPPEQPTTHDGSCPTNNNQPTIPDKIKVPLLGEINTKNISLPVLTLLIGGLDGFNPCAMWILFFLISLFLGMKNRKRMWILGLTFIAVSALVYFIFLAAWLNFLLFIGLVFWIRIFIGLIALATGFYHLRDYFTHQGGVCKVSQSQRRQKILERLKRITQKKQFLLALGGIILLAFGVNLVELICSAGLPAVYTQILTLNKVPQWQYYLYLILYIIIYMLDDMIVFVIAMVTLRLTGLSGKYTKIAALIGGILMVIIGTLLLLRPELLMFG